MKKYLIPAIILVLIAGAICIRRQVLAPGRAAARDLEALNGLTVGKTTEAELLSRAAFQTEELNCFGEVCMYRTLRENKLLSALHLAAPASLTTTVTVRNGIVTHVNVNVSRAGLIPLSVSQTSNLPVGCVSPCVNKKFPATKFWGVNFLLGPESELRNRWPQVFDARCLSRIHGCNSYGELIPLSNQLKLEAATKDIKDY
jgi:hypothetical protein